jgi:hypothetical protein
VQAVIKWTVRALAAVGAVWVGWIIATNVGLISLCTPDSKMVIPSPETTRSAILEVWSCGGTRRQIRVWAVSGQALDDQIPLFRADGAELSASVSWDSENDVTIDILGTPNVAFPDDLTIVNTIGGIDVRYTFQ